MALIKCSECEKKISDKAQVCPNCGNPISHEVKPEVRELRTTNISQVEPKKGTGIICLAIGIIVALFSLLIMPLGIVPLIGAIGVIIYGTGSMSSKCKADCPYCGKENVFHMSSESVRCIYCHKTSVRNNDTLKEVD